MPYLAFELDAKKTAVKVARSVGVEPCVVAWALLELWEHVWETKQPIVTELVLFGCIGPSTALRDALVAFDFLERVENGYRVRGASRYLRVSEARADAGKKRVAGAHRDTKGRLTSKPPALAGDVTSKPPALPPSTEHRTPNTDLFPSETGEKGWNELVAALFLAFETQRRSGPNPRPKDWKALKRLRERTRGNDSEILARWTRGLAAQFKQHVDSFWDLDDRWDSLTADATAPPGRVVDIRRSPVRAEDIPKEAFAVVGDVSHDF